MPGLAADRQSPIWALYGSAGLWGVGCAGSARWTHRWAPLAIWRQCHGEPLPHDGIAKPGGRDAICDDLPLRGFGRRRDRFGLLLLRGLILGCFGGEGSRHWASGRLAGRARALIGR